VKRGQALLQMHDRDLELELAGAHAQIAESEALELRALREQTADLMPIRSRLEAIKQHLNQLEEMKAALTVRAKHDGQWVAPEVDHIAGAWLARGTPLGQVINAKSFYFSAIVSEQDASRLFTPEIRLAQVRLRGQAGITLPVTGQKIIPAEHEVLPSPALGWHGGGEVAVQLTDSSGVRAAEPFFEVRATVEPMGGAAILHGRSGKIRFQLAPEPLLDQWIRKLRQLLQKQYGV
jgi:putative peptide zinc metalloprotease protein